VNREVVFFAVGASFLVGASVDEIVRDEGVAEIFELGEFVERVGELVEVDFVVERVRALVDSCDEAIELAFALSFDRVDGFVFAEKVLFVRGRRSSQCCERASNKSSSRTLFGFLMEPERAEFF
jgi:hypothetical protein